MTVAIQGDDRVTDLKELIERIEAADGPDRELDAAVWGAATGGDVWSYDDNAHIDALIKSGAYRGDKQLHPDYEQNPRVTWRYRISDDYGEVPEVTASIDAALALTERMLPGWGLQMSAGNMFADGRAFATAYCVDETRRDYHYEGEGEGDAATLPLAIILALLRALESQP